MIEQLEVPYLDACAEELVWELGAPPHPALAVRSVDAGWARLDLRLLGASHQVLAHRHDGAPACSELVACRPGVPGALPASVEADVTGLRYAFRSDVTTATGGGVAAAARDLLGRLSARPDALVGAFPGSPHAVTAIEVVPGGWRTWHLYPQAGQVVTTETSLRR